MSNRPAKHWTVPVAGGHYFELVVETNTVELRSSEVVHGQRVVTARVGLMTPVEACQLGMALLEASKEAATRTKR